MAKLREKQKRFADYYIQTGNATEAARMAGYSQKSARFVGAENLTKPNILEYINKKLEEIESKRIADATEVLEYLTEVLRGESETEEVISGSFGAERVTKRPNERERLKAAELLGKRYGLYTDKVDLSGDLDLNVVVDYGEDKN